MDTVQSRLYPDFILSRDNCHEEPIHRPVAIQGHGHMLVLTDRPELRVHSISDCFAAALGRDTDALFGEPVMDWLPEIFHPLLSSAKNRQVSCQYSTPWDAPDGKTYDIVFHHSDDCIVFECELVSEAEIDVRTLPAIGKQFRSESNISALYQTASSLIATVFGFDRVMVYQFDKDNHGSVVGEHKREDLESFLGLHYPETDIPKIARDMFLLVRSRSIGDIYQDNNQLIFNPQLGLQIAHLDLTNSQLRAISPCHIEYLGNMGVRATLVLSLVVGGALWGLVACHHYSSKRVRFNSRAMGEVVGDMLAKRISELQTQEAARLASEGRAVEVGFLKKVKLSENYRIEILENASDTLKLCQADGVALVTLDDCPFRIGTAPEKSVLLAIRDWLVNNGHDEVFYTSKFDTVIEHKIDGESPIGGMMSSCLSNISGSYLMWFRKTVSQSVFWAGDPENSYSLKESSETGEVHLSPRDSFAKWQVVVEGQSLRWEDSAVQMAIRVREGIVRKELLYTAEKIKRSNEDFMQLTYAAVHDLQEPLRTQTNYLELMEESLGQLTKEEQIKYVLATKHATNRMRELIRDLLSYASVSSENQRQVVSVQTIVEEVLDELTTTIKQSGASIELGKLPNIRGDSIKLMQFFQNLLTNAMKYVAPDTAPMVRVYMEDEGTFCNLCVQDNGIGIDSQHFEIIFKLFQRLHRKSEYAGTGIGLATCKKIAESMDAEITVESELGCGSTFRLKIHNSIIVR
ncbi:MAG: ATP-binding protein [Granulosicoccus sp.]